MSSFTKNHPVIYSFYCIVCVLPFVISLPVLTKDDPFDKFIEYLSKTNCSMPKEIELPFSVTTDSVPFSYLSYPLNECKTSDAVKENNEANLLCREVFDVIQNITCFDYKLNNSIIESSKLSTDVCQDFAAIQDVIPKRKDLLSRKFEDGIICKVMCTGKYELLCKTLLWGYDTQAKLKNATSEQNVAVKAEDNLENHPDSNEITDEEITSNKALNKDSVNNVASDAKPEIPTVDETAKNKSTMSVTEDKTKESENHIEKAEVTDPQKTNFKNIDKPIKTSNVIVIQPITEAASKSSNDLNDQNKNTISEQNIKHEQDQNIKSEQDQNIIDNKDNDVGENNTEMPSKSSSKNDEVNVPTIDVNISASDAKGDEIVDVDVPVQGEDNKVDVADNKEETKSVSNPTVPKIEEENDLKKSGHENVKQDEAKETQDDLDSKGVDIKENEIPNGENESNVAEPTVPIFPDIKEDFEQQPELKDPEQYNDSENDGDYAKQEYDTAFNPALKKESSVKNTLNDGSSQFNSGSNMQISNENFLGHESDINRNFLPARNYLPDQEDSHFFFYFLTIVLVLMAGYLIFHNKQKIIALIVEGRHERRRRSHNAGYKKLETK